MKKLLLLFFLTSSCAVWAQGITWGVNIAPSIAYRIAQRSPLNERITSAQLSEKPMHAFDFGFDVRKTIGERFRIGAAVLYSRKGFSNNHAAATFRNSQISAAYLVDYMQDNLEIPFFLTYSVIKKEKTEAYPLLGMTHSLLLGDKNNVSVRAGGEVREEITEQLRKPYLSPTRLHNVGLLFGGGAMTRVDCKTSVGIEVQGKVMLTPLQDVETHSHRYLTSIGVNFRFIRHLGGKD